jgi:pyruvate/2-oxoglutarate dehydrogenase complex dihydrolipoamide acyltransferase (E2) component
MRNLMYPVKKEPYVKPEAKRTVPPDGTEWRCPACNKDLFGKFKNGQLHIKYRERSLMVQGTVSVPCRACGYVATLDTRAYAYPVTLEYARAEDDGLTVSPEATEQAIKLAREHGIDLREVKGSGVNGKIVVKDVRGLIE